MNLHHIKKNSLKDIDKNLFFYYTPFYNRLKSPMGQGGIGWHLGVDLIMEENFRG
jgi:hypothetical protein